MAIKKQWYEIIAPKIFGEKIIGETLAIDSKQLIGRKIEISLMDLLKDYSRFFIKLQFQIERVEDNKAFTKFIGHDCMRERIYRMIQRRIRRVDCVQDVITQDKIKIRIKTIFVLIRRVNTSIKDAARRKAKQMIKNTAKESRLEDFIKSIISGKLQQSIKRECNKISPIGSIEIRKSEVLKEKKKKEMKPELKVE